MRVIYTIMQTSLLEVPQAFNECEVRVYDKRELKDRIKDDKDVLKDLRYAMNNYHYHAMSHAMHYLLNINSIDTVMP